MALPIAVMALVVLTTLVTAYLSLGSFEPQASRNLTDGARVRFVAEAGIEFGFHTLAATTNWTTLLQTNNGVLASNSAIPGLTTTSGTYTVTLRNDVCAAASTCNALGDTALTGLPLDTGAQNGGGAADNNNTVIMTSVATLGTATKTITVVVGRVNLPPTVAALAFPGQQADTNFNGASFDVKGTDTNLDDSAGAGAPVFGIAVSNVFGTPPGANEALVEGTLSNPQKERVVGSDGSGTTTGTPTIVAEGTLTQTSIQKFVQAAKAVADISLTSTAASHPSFTNIGDSCATNLSSSTCWGTTAHPKIVYIKGDQDPTGAYNALSLSGGTTGSGILVIEDGDLDVTGNFRWEGLILVTGKYVGVAFRGGGDQSVYGGVISNEMASDEERGLLEGLVAGNAKLLYSSQAMSNVQNSQKLLRVYSWRES
jgi:hypothetical protein